MANCNKCGAKRITKRRAGVWSCRHCGVQGGTVLNDIDRSGNAVPPPAEPKDTAT